MNVLIRRNDWKDKDRNYISAVTVKETFVVDGVLYMLTGSNGDCLSIQNQKSLDFCVSTAVRTLCEEGYLDLTKLEMIWSNVADLA